MRLITQKMSSGVIITCKVHNYSKKLIFRHGNELKKIEISSNSFPLLLLLRTLFVFNIFQNSRDIFMISVMLFVVSLCYNFLKYTLSVMYYDMLMK